MPLQTIAADPGVRDARAAVHTQDRDTLDEQIRIASIPAPTGLETERATYIRTRLEELGLTEARIDAIGNVTAKLEGAHPSEGAPVVVAAHLDTVFPGTEPIVPRLEGERVFAPGISDNARGLAAMLALVRAIRKAGVRTRRSVIFAATVGEEGAGDLRGVKHLFRDGSDLLSTAAFISIDGAGLTRIVNRAIGARRLRATYVGLGGHSWGDRGLANPAHALGDAIARVARLEPPGSSPFSVTVGRLGGGTSVNAVPEAAWLELDLRAGERETLEWLSTTARKVLEKAAKTESRRAARGAVVLGVEEIGNRPCGATSDDSPLVQAAVAATRTLGAIPELSGSSTDANVPISLGIPAIAIGAGGRAGGVHTLSEWFENQGGARGVERALLTLLAVAGVHDRDQVEAPELSTTE